MEIRKEFTNGGGDCGDGNWRVCIFVVIQLHLINTTPLSHNNNLYTHKMGYCCNFCSTRGDCLLVNSCSNKVIKDWDIFNLS